MANNNLVGGFNPSEKYEFVSWDYEIPNMMGKIIHSCSKPPAMFSPNVEKASHHSADRCWSYLHYSYQLNIFLDFTQFRVIIHMWPYLSILIHTYISVFVLNIYLLAKNTVHMHHAFIDWGGILGIVSG